MKGLWTATLNKHSPRFETWLEILGAADDVPISAPYTRNSELGVPVQEKAEVYNLDPAKLTNAQRDRLVAFVVEKFGAEPEEVFETVARDGFPIRAEDVNVAFSLRAFL